MKHFLFVCSQNRLRSPTAEHIFADYPGIEVSSAGTNNDAENPLTAELVEWADTIFVMERAHRNKLQKRFRSSIGAQRVVCLDIPDDYEFMMQVSPALANSEQVTSPSLRVGATSSTRRSSSLLTPGLIDRSSNRFLRFSIRREPQSKCLGIVQVVR